MDLVIVESPTKAKTLKRFLGQVYQIESSMGHLRDLPADKLGVSTRDNFQPIWVMVKGKSQVVADLKKAAQKAPKIILATDPDREGEAIAWHVQSLLRGVGRDERFQRIVFHEITKSAIERALKKPRAIDLSLVAAQKTRRILDRLVGYKVSPILWRKVRQGLSAGRVQSLVVRLIVEREKEIKQFQAEHYWRIFSALTLRRQAPMLGIGEPESQARRACRSVSARGKINKLRCQVSEYPSRLTKKDAEPFIAELVAYQDQLYETTETEKLFCGQHTIRKTSIASASASVKIIKDLTRPFIVKKIEKRETLSFPPAPFITSTLQQTAGHRFGWSGKMTMRTAQQLYEKGLITYHRTDSTHLAKSAVAAIRQYLRANFQASYLPKQVLVYKTKSKVAQEAHEAIRPTAVKLKITNDKFKINKNEEKLYQLIWQRTVACQMAAARLEKTDLEISCGPYLFSSQGQRLLFDGYLKVSPLRISENFLPSLEKGDRLDLVALGASQSTTTAPARYTEAALVKTLEKEGIGRPSTYAPIVSLVQKRQYVEKNEAKFQPTALGEAVNQFLVKNFENIVEIPFTAQMEADLDKIANGEKEWLTVLQAFWQPFGKKLTEVKEKAQRIKVKTKKVNEKCKAILENGKPCPGELVIRIGRFGKFIGCSNFPECKYTRPYVVIFKGVKCPVRLPDGQDCGGDVVIKKSKKGKQFYGCSRYPKCTWASWTKPQRQVKTKKTGL